MPSMISSSAPGIDADPLARIEGGRDTAAAIPGAELLIIEGMGHDLPRGAWPRIIDAIDAHASKASPRAADARDGRGRRA